MPIFLVTPLQGNGLAIREKVVEAFPEAYYELQSKVGWFVHFPGTAVQLANALTVTGQPEGQPAPLGSVLITSVGSYFGRGSADMWEWLKTRVEAGT